MEHMAIGILPVELPLFPVPGVPPLGPWSFSTVYAEALHLPTAAMQYPFMALDARRGGFKRRKNLEGSIVGFQGLVNVPFWEYWTSPYSSHYRPYT